MGLARRAGVLGPSGALTGGMLGSVSLLSPGGSRASLLPFNLGHVLLDL